MPRGRGKFWSKKWSELAAQPHTPQNPAEKFPTEGDVTIGNVQFANSEIRLHAEHFTYLLKIKTQMPKMHPVFSWKKRLKFIII